MSESAEHSHGKRANVTSSMSESAEHSHGKHANVTSSMSESAEHCLGKRANVTSSMSESAEHSLGKRANVTACEQQRGGYNEVRECTDGVGVTLDELRKTDSGCFTIKPPVTIAYVGRRRYRYHRCVECGRKRSRTRKGNMVAATTLKQIQKRRTA